MANFAVAASPETIERANKIMDMYAQEGDKKEDTLLRILDLAENDSVRGTHPEFEGALKAVDSTIGTLIKQINGIVAGQDSQIAGMKTKLEASIVEKNSVLEEAQEMMRAAKERSSMAETIIEQGREEIKQVKESAQEEITQAKKDAATAIEKSNTERDQALRERDDARTIAAEKTASNDLLMRQMQKMEADAAAYKALQEMYDKITADLASMQTQLDAKDRALADAKRDAETARKAAESDFSSRMEVSKAQSDLALEKAVNAAVLNEREKMRDQLRQADKENARLTVQVEQLQAQLDRVTVPTSNN